MGLINWSGKTIKAPDSLVNRAGLPTTTRGENECVRSNVFDERLFSTSGSKAPLSSRNRTTRNGFESGL